MIRIGDRPILWHIMKTYAHFGHNDFLLALGWLGEEIKKFFLDYEALTSNFTVRLRSPTNLEFHSDCQEVNWSITCLDTGRDSLTGTRVRIAAGYIKDASRLMVTYGDGVGDINISSLLSHHERSGRLATVTTVQPPSRFGELIVDNVGRVVEFAEKPQTSSGLINGGFMVFESAAIEKYFPADKDYMLEREPLAALAADGELTAYTHGGFWQPMDTPRERDLLEDLWNDGVAPWKLWS